jgi:hypothetical protein
MSPSHPTEGDNSGQGSQNRDALGSYTWRYRDIGQASAGSFTKLTMQMQYMERLNFYMSMYGVPLVAWKGIREMNALSYQIM